MTDPKSVKPPFYPPGKIHEIVEAFRKEHAVWGEVPVDIERIAEIGLGIRFRLIEGLRAKVDADALLLNTEPDEEVEMVIDQDEYNDERFWGRLRFSIAHEIGHLVLHRDVYKGVSFAFEDEWIQFFGQVPAETHFFLEYQASEFAGRLLVPREILKQELDNQLNIRGLKLPLHPDYVDVFTNAISRRFHVSPGVIRVRFDREKLIGELEDD